ADLERLLALDEALRQLAGVSPRQARIVELRYFGGLDLDEIAQLLEVSPSTITRERQAAEAWLSRAVARP
ncbi:MAG: RNA polymerase subunit sigma-70, partial [Acidobacteriota bacterium]|nr:RNA polymerase subunit sigma-70 [Acidobacteriota bacterium]